MSWRVPSWEVYREGVEALDTVAASVGVTVAKAGGSPLTPDGFDDAVRALFRRLAKTTRAADRAAIKRAVAKLERDFAAMSAASRERAIKSAASEIVGVPQVVIGSVSREIGAAMVEMVTIAKREAVRTYRLRIEATFNARDERIIDFAEKSQGSYITDRYGQRAVAFERKARDIVSRGLESGLGRADLGDILRAELTDPALRASEAYWETVASVHMARARSWGQLASFQDAGIDEYTWESVIDEVTTDQCRFLHGRTFTVSRAVDLFAEVHDSDDPEAVKKKQPWLKVGRTSDGGRGMYVDHGDGRKFVSEIRSSGVGVSDKIGDYSAVSSAALQKLGVGTPPAHARCRSTIVPA